MRWIVKHESINSGVGRLSYFSADDSILTWRGLFEAWRSGEFADLFSDSIVMHPNGAVRWESPPLTSANLDQRAEFVLTSSPSLDRQPDKFPFAHQLENDPLTATFTNLGRDATLVVPGELDPDTNYVHLSAFLRTAPTNQKRELWAAVSAAVRERLSEKPMWLSTAGGGVAWLHVRIDDRPKYYVHRPYTDRPA